MKSPIFQSGVYLEIADQVRRFVNEREDFLTPISARSPRAVGDAIQELLGESFQSIIGAHSREYSNVFARRSMADLAFKDIEENYYIVDVKTHRTSTAFNMPNLTSADRLARFYEDDSNYFVLLLVRYDIAETRVTVSEVLFVPIEFLNWQCLTIGALGWGQIQIANANQVMVEPRSIAKTVDDSDVRRTPGVLPARDWEDHATDQPI